MPSPPRLTGAVRWMRGHPRLSIVFGLFLGAAGVSAIVPPLPSRPPTKPAAEQDMTVPTDVSPTLVERFVSPRLKNAGSALYQGVTYRLRQGVPTFCGEVDGRNGFGGYSGFQHFIATGPVVDFERSENRRAFRRSWHELCVLTDGDDAPKASSSTTGGEHGA